MNQEAFQLLCGQLMTDGLSLGNPPGGRLRLSAGVSSPVEPSGCLRPPCCPSASGGKSVCIFVEPLECDTHLLSFPLQQRRGRGFPVVRRGPERKGVKDFYLSLIKHSVCSPSVLITPYHVGLGQQTPLSLRGHLPSS